MPTVTMPQLGESVAEGTIGKWLKQVGDAVELGEPIVEVVTDKVNAEVPSPFAGTLTQILVGEGQTVPNDASIAVIEASSSTAAPTPPAATSAASAPVTTGAPAAVTTSAALIAVPVAPRPFAVPSAPAVAVGEYRGRMTPAVRRLAREHAVDLGRVPGTGFGGRVTRDDVLGYVAANGNGSAAAAATPAASAPAAPAAPALAAAPAGPSADYLKPLTKIRRAIAAQMTRAAAVPTAYETVEVDMSSVVRLRDKRKREYAEREGMGLSFVAFVTKAAVEALRRNPDLNGHYTDEGHWVRRDINIGVAVAVDDGLMVPVIGGADQLSIHGLNRAVNDLAARARISKLKVNEVSGGTFTVDNTGWTGSILTLPIINVPEIAILTMEAIVKKPVVVETAGGDSIAIRPMMAMVLGFDHRATDGAQAGKFLTDVKRWLESVDDSTPVW
jgi:pyruvate/2-oxoglutarate dehydrogenase complex dihydrolipoamide acyltransferase (E2) component